MTLIQLSSRSGVVRTPIFQYSPPDFIELYLEDNQRVVQIEWKRGVEYHNRKTVDWTWTVWTESRW